MSCEKYTPSQALLPVFLLSFAFMAFLGFQAWLLATDHASLNEAYTQQDKTLDQVAKVKTQVNALAKGTLTLAQQGDKNAQAIIEQLKKAGINVQEAPAQGQQPAEGTPPQAQTPSKP